MSNAPVRLSTLAHGGGCGCKLDPEVLRKLLADQPAAGPFERRCLSATRRPTTPRSGHSTMAPASSPPPTSSRRWWTILAISAASPRRTRSRTSTRWAAARSWRSPSSACRWARSHRNWSPRSSRAARASGAEAGIPVAGGHSIDTPEPIYGLAVIGTCRRDEVRRNADARAGDALILTKPLGVGVYSAAIKREILPEGGYADFIATTTRLNRIGTDLARDPAVHAITDVTGFGVLGHGLELARGAGLTLEISADALPLHPAAEALARDGAVTAPRTATGRPSAKRWICPRLPGMAPPPVDRPADVRRPAHLLRRGGRRGDPRPGPRRRLRAGVDHRTHSDRPCADPDHLISLLRPVAAIGAMPKLTGFRPGIRECLRLDGLALPPCDSRQMRPLRSLFD